MYALVIYPKGFRKGWKSKSSLVPEVMLLEGIDNIYDARHFAVVYTLEHFNSPQEFDGCHVVKCK